MSSSLLPLLLTAIAPLVARAADTSSSSAVPTYNYIDTISGYDELSTCAENVLSTIVRAQYSGCGDHGALTSYTCFCTDSSSLFSYEITSAISESCATSIWSAQATSAIQIFNSYCDLGVEAGLVPATAIAATASATASATPAATASTAASATASATTSTASSAVNHRDRSRRGSPCRRHRALAHWLLALASDSEQTAGG
ncbi:hypothetical protein M406DRAFT_348469 [Cryphonectria parasitica EP155]|uniref:Extracellular membrane protein CFEM domain-containing protein n=1 Tax=Cryphonectria parasitica (strain ATCC 38755 / EP155) TaxID=660469 RepID=A0A9P4XUM4_CRYP1|nr:uncharacterized protein M406DRAFT_348469 [Cryphonectria parasitica EP155]KAF3761198.1 hypothetical protein M406DRAFT_348469 [Cryphonectria parasitica EP155]